MLDDCLYKFHVFFIVCAIKLIELYYNEKKKICSRCCFRSDIHEYTGHKWSFFLNIPSQRYQRIPAGIDIFECAEEVIGCNFSKHIDVHDLGKGKLELKPSNFGSL